MNDNVSALLPASFPALRQGRRQWPGDRLAAALAHLAVAAFPKPSRAASHVAGQSEDALRDLIHELSGEPVEPSNASTPSDIEASGPESSDRRAFPRRDSRCITLVHRWDQNRAATEHDKQWLLHASQLRGRLVNVSMNGVAFVHSEPLAAGDHLMVRMSNPIYKQSIDKPVIVVRSSPAGSGEWKTICRFQRTLSFDEISMLGRQLVGPALV